MVLQAERPRQSERTGARTPSRRGEISPIRVDRASDILSLDPQKRGFGKALETLVPPLSSASYLRETEGRMNHLLGARSPGRTFTILGAMDSDTIATYTTLRKLYPDTPILIVYPRMENDIDNQRQGRRDLFVQIYGAQEMSLSDITAAKEGKAPLPLTGIYEPDIDGAVKEFQKSSGLSIDEIAGSHGLLYNNALGTLLNSYWKLAANATKGVLIGTLNGSSIALGDYYHFALDGMYYPLSSLYRSDVNRLLRDMNLPKRLRDVSPWQQKVRLNGQPTNEFWDSRPLQNSDPHVKMLPRNFYRIADPALYFLERGYSVAQTAETILQSLEAYSQREYKTSIAPHDVALVTQMVDATNYLRHAAKGKNHLDKDKLAPRLG